MRRLLIPLLLWAWPSLAAPMDGAEDPAFQSAWESLLTSDDPTALRDLHTLAAQGNTAALIALPLAQRWLPPQPDRMDLRRIGPAWVRDLGQTAHKPAALWADGDISQGSGDQMNRALALYDIGETAKADTLLGAWYNHMPMAAPLPEGFAALDASPRLKALILLEHLTRGDRKALAPLQALLDQDRIEGWMALAELNDHYPVTAGQPIQANLTLGPNAGTRLADGRRALRLMWNEEPKPPLPAEVLSMATADLLPRSAYAPIRAFCAAHCPGTEPACGQAFLSLLGRVHPSVAQSTPLIGLMDQNAFFATPRGEQVLLGTAVKHRLLLDLVPDPAAHLDQNPAFQTARSLDACFADAATRALHPFPTAP